ncbi:hypothetical protein ACFWPH_32775 [Nocardia sp. NPDC058499]|uniref:pPIWI_RE_Z domain-containing protein n=1 Tax=Nocardia sp. NPDC058499 TaxID=3346530 RepID=UPI00366960A0
MRSRSGWHNKLAAQLRPAWPTAHAGFRPGDLLDVELGLYVQYCLNPQRNASDAGTLLTGYPFGEVFGDVTTEEDRRRIGRARHYLWDLRRRHEWRQHLAYYLSIPVDLRGFDFPDIDSPPVRLVVSHAPKRFDVFDELLESPPLFATHTVTPAEPGEYDFMVRDSWQSVTFPLELLRNDPAAPTHQLSQPAIGEAGPIEATWEQLEQAARDMDAAEPDERDRTWFARLDRVRLLTRNTDLGEFARSDTLRIDRLLNLVGMVGAGKSTLRDILAYWVIKKQGRRVTIVVGDVAEVLAVTQRFTGLGIAAAPVLGHSTRHRNIERLHRRLASSGADSMIDHDHPGFAYLSSACPTDALRGVQARKALRIGEAPCYSLYAADNDTDTDIESDGAQAEPRHPRKGRHSCPLWSRCPRHHAPRALVDALLWVATPAGLVHSAVPAPQNREQIRYLELACRTSGLIVIDEADRVQMQLDSIFAPATTLAGRSPNSWLDEVAGHKISELARDGRLQLSRHDVDDWTNAVNTVNSAVDRFYGLVINHPELLRWIGEDYFSALTLHRQLIADWFPEQRRTDGTREPLPAEAAARVQRLNAVLDLFRDDPVRERDGTEADADAVAQVNQLVRMTLGLLHAHRESTTRQRVKTVLLDFVGSDVIAEDELDQYTLRFEFTLILAALHNRLDFMTIVWPRVEPALNLETTSNVLSRRPPKDYEPIIPESPMGNILGFQFRPGDRDSDGHRSGELRFFRCSGVGRELMLSLHDLPSVDARPGANILLMSGTSWAGTSSRFHIHAAVGAILQPHDDEIRAVRATTFRPGYLYWPTTEGAQEPIRLSGAHADRRRAALHQMLTQLATPDRTLADAVSLLQTELDEIRYEDPDRARVLLLVGSYDDAKFAAETLNEIPEWTGRITQLIADDADFDDSWSAMAATGTHRLRRGDVAKFTGEVLVAPLLAVERGHNIVLAGGKAAIGTVYFLARPHPRPDDISLAIQAINDWAVREVRSSAFARKALNAGTLDRAGIRFRARATAEWHRLLTRRIAWSSLDDTDKAHFTWDQLVVMWQVIGRLVRGGVSARVVFVDAAFAPREAAFRGTDTAATSLLASMREVLAPYFDEESDTDPMDRSLVQALYEPLFLALCSLDAALV